MLVAYVVSLGLKTAYIVTVSVLRVFPAISEGKHLLNEQ